MDNASGERFVESVRMYVMYPPSYSVWAARIVFCAPKLMRDDAACWRVLVMNGGGGLLVVRFFSIERTVKRGQLSRWPVNVVRLRAAPLASGSSVVLSLSRTKPSSSAARRASALFP